MEWEGNAEDYGWMERERWAYRGSLPGPDLPPGHRLVLVLEGVDHDATVSVAGEALGRLTGMNGRLELDATGRGGQPVEVVVEPAPRVEGARDGRREAAGATKPAVSYGWDFAPRLVPLGLWRPAYAEARPAAAAQRAEVFAEPAEDLASAVFTAEIDFHGPPEARIRWRVSDADGVEVHTAEAEAGVPLAFTLDRPRLWWPHTHGQPHLYRSETAVTHADGTQQRFTQRVSVRRVRLVMHEGAWDEPALFAFPKTRSNPPTTVEFNGRRIFCQGSNVVAPDLFPSRLDSEDGRARCDRLLGEAVSMRFNPLRLWGGAVAPPGHFYDRCDEMGILCWQEFPLSCNRYAESDAYLAELRADARALVLRLRRHPSLAFWCGGNELFNEWSGMTDQHPALRLLGALCFELDPQRPFLPSMPVMGVAHGSYVFRLPDGREVFEYLPAASYTAYPEFGVPGPAPLATLERIIPEAERFPPRRDGAWTKRHAFDAWNVVFDTWFEVERIRDYFGELPGLAAVVERGQLLQAEGLRFAFEEGRRQAPKCGMFLNWCFNEPWPSAANNSVLAWPAEPKPACAAIRSACRPTLLSLKAPKFSWAAGEVLEAELWLLNDADEPAPACEAVVSIGGEAVTLAAPGAAPRSNTRAGMARLTVPAGSDPTFELRVTAEGRDAWANAYTLVRRAVPEP